MYFVNWLSSPLFFPCFVLPCLLINPLLMLFLFGQKEDQEWLCKRNNPARRKVHFLIHSKLTFRAWLSNFFSEILSEETTEKLLLKTNSSIQNIYSSKIIDRHLSKPAVLWSDSIMFVNNQICGFTWQIEFEFCQVLSIPDVVTQVGSKLI